MNETNSIRKIINILLCAICIISLASIFLADKITVKLYGLSLILYVIGYIKFIQK